jgi:hypothetical protein
MIRALVGIYSNYYDTWRWEFLLSIGLSDSKSRKSTSDKYRGVQGAIILLSKAEVSYILHV